MPRPSPSASDPRSGWTWPILLALAGFALDLVLAWPGQMSFDSAYAWWQARGNETSNVTPPFFVALWRLTRLVGDGPGAMFALQLVLHWSGIILLMRALGLGAAASRVFVLVAAFMPLPLILRGHVWTDVMLTAFLVFATGLLAAALHDPRSKAWLIASGVMLVVAALLRHNGLIAILPLAWMWSRALPFASAPSRIRPRLAAAMLIVFAALAAQVAERSVDRRVALWPALAEFDLAALSIATDRLLLPPFMVGPGFEVDELREAFRPWSNVPMLSGTQHGLREPFSIPPEHLGALRDAWFDAIVDHPAAWLAHKLRVARLLFLRREPISPRELVFVDEEFAYRDNPPVAANSGVPHAWLMQQAQALLDTPWLAAWPYLLVGVAAMPFAWRRRGDGAGALACALLASAWLYAASFMLLAPAAEIRYLDWPCVASLLAAASIFMARREPQGIHHPLLDSS